MGRRRPLTTSSILSTESPMNHRTACATVLWRNAGWVLATVAAGLLGCGDGYTPRPMVLIDHRLRQELAALSDTVAILVMQPAACVSCNNAITDWREWATDQPTHRHLVVLISHPPSARERQLLSETRLVPEMILQASQVVEGEATVYLAIDGVIADSASSQSHLLTLLRRVTARSQSALTEHRARP